MSYEQQPPAWIKRFLRWYCKEEHLEAIEGDLDEEFQDFLESHGMVRAKRYYLLEVCRFIRAYTVKNKLPQSINHVPMIRNYFKTAFRNILKARAFSAINITGLSVSLALSIMVLLMLSGMMKTDEHHQHAERIYRVISHESSSEGLKDVASTTESFAYPLSTDFPEVQSVLRLHLKRNQRIRTELGFQRVNQLFADATFLDFFDFELLYGQPDDLFSDPSAIILSENTSERLFGNRDPLGEILTFDTKQKFVVKGVLRSLPRNKETHLQFDLISPFAHLENMQRNGQDQGLNDFGNIWQHYLYVKLQEDAGTVALERGLNEYFEKNFQSEGATYTFSLQSLRAIRPGKWLYNQMGPNTPVDAVYLIISLIGLLMFIACFNYTNLSVARALKRSREVGIRKVLGARRGQLIFQFIVEAVVISLFALVLAFPIHDLLMVPLMQSMNPVTAIPKITELNVVELSQIVLFTILTGFVAGIFPSLLLSSIKIVSVIKGANNINLFSRIKLRKVLIVLQFMISMVLVVSVVTTTKQYMHQRTVDYGFDHEHIVNIELQGIDHLVLANELSKVPGVAQISASSIYPGGRSYAITLVQAMGSPEKVQTELVYADYNFLDTYDLQLIAGRNFSEGFGADAFSSIIITESTLPAFSFESPQVAIGAVLNRGEEAMRVIGVIKDFTAISLSGNAPMLLKLNPEEFRFLSVRTLPGSTPEVMDAIEGIWPRIEPENPVQYSAFSETIERMYESMQEQIFMFLFFAGIVIVISILGLFGMAIYTAESRIKEVGVRKVMGGTVKQITLLLSKDFMRLVGIGTILGTPVAWFLNDALLQDYKYRIDMSPLIFVVSALIMLILAMLTIGSQTVKAAQSNPVATLRQD